MGAKLHMTAYIEQFLDLILMFTIGTVEWPAFWSPRRLFRHIRAGAFISQDSFRDSAALGKLLARSGIEPYRLDKFLETAKDINSKVVMAIFADVHHTVASGPSFWASLSVRNELGSVASIMQRLSEFAPQRSYAHRAKTRQKRIQEGPRHLKNCSECGASGYIWMEVPDRRKSSCTGCEKDWLAKQPPRSRQAYLGCGNEKQRY